MGTFSSGSSLCCEEEGCFRWREWLQSGDWTLIRYSGQCQVCHGKASHQQILWWDQSRHRQVCFWCQRYTHVSGHGCCGDPDRLGKSRHEQIRASRFYIWRDCHKDAQQCPGKFCTLLTCETMLKRRNCRLPYQSHWSAVYDRGFIWWITLDKPNWVVCWSNVLLLTSIACPHFKLAGDK